MIPIPVAFVCFFSRLFLHFCYVRRSFICYVTFVVLFDTNQFCSHFIVLRCLLRPCLRSYVRSCCSYVGDVCCLLLRSLHSLLTLFIPRCWFCSIFFVRYDRWYRLRRFPFILVVVRFAFVYVCVCSGPDLRCFDSFCSLRCCSILHFVTLFRFLPDVFFAFWWRCCFDLFVCSLFFSGVVWFCICCPFVLVFCSFTFLVFVHTTTFCARCFHSFHVCWFFAF